MAPHNRQHGDTSGGTNAKEYVAWRNIKSRCLRPENPDYAGYGGRGITICARWAESYAAFLADVGRAPSPAHSIDRFPDNDGNYEPGNVRWATIREQQRNMRSNRWIECNGERLTLAAWAERYGMLARTLASRLVLGWSIERALATPIGAQYAATRRCGVCRQPGHRRETCPQFRSSEAAA